MPPRKTSGPGPALTFEPDRFYAVRLARSTEWKGKPLRRGRDLELRGDVCQALRDDIAQATPVAVVTG